jgi:hypothetical protein
MKPERLVAAKSGASADETTEPQAPATSGCICSEQNKACQGDGEKCVATIDACKVTKDEYGIPNGCKKEPTQVSCGTATNASVCPNMKKTYTEIKACKFNGLDCDEVLGEEKEVSCGAGGASVATAGQIVDGGTCYTVVNEFFCGKNENQNTCSVTATKAVKSDDGTYECKADGEPKKVTCKWVDLAQTVE